MSHSCSDHEKNWSDNVFADISVGKDETRLFGEYIDSTDLSTNSQRAVVNDLRKFARWFVGANHEPLTFARATTRDITDFRDYLRRDQQQAVSTVNRALVSVRRLFRWLCEEGYLQLNPAKGVKELRKQELAPKGLDRSQVRRLFREVELRNDVRANAVFSFIIYTGCRVGDLVALKLDDILMTERSGTAVFRTGKGNKQRSVPVPLAARKALIAYLETRPSVEGDAVFVGERGPLTDKGVRGLCDKFSVICGFKIHPHLLRHTMAHKFLEDNPGDLVSLAQILGHENLNTTKRYVARTEQQLADAAERMQF